MREAEEVGLAGAGGCVLEVLDIRYVIFIARVFPNKN